MALCGSLGSVSIARLAGCQIGSNYAGTPDCQIGAAGDISLPDWGVNILPDWRQIGLARPEQYVHNMYTVRLYK